MALTDSDKRELEIMMRKEIKDFFGHNTMRQFEEKLMDNIAKEIKRGKLEDDIKDIVVRVFREFYNFMWTNRSYWESRIKTA
jgi:hypothetical protein